MTKMKGCLVILLGLCTVSSVCFADEIPCQNNPNCTCDLTQYDISETPPLPTLLCFEKSMNIYISKCQLIKNQYNITSLALRNNTGPECEGQDYLVNGSVQVVFHNSLTVGTCGNILTINDTHATFSNRLHIYAQPTTIQARNNLIVDMNCSFPLFLSVQLNTSIKPKLTSAQLQVPGVFGAFTVMMALYTDISFTKLYSDDTSALSVEDPIYVGVSIPNLEASSFSVKVMRIYAIAENGSAVFNLTNEPDGCPNSSYGPYLIEVIINGKGNEARFKIKVFKLTGYEILYLYASVTVCPWTCISQCNTNNSIKNQRAAATLKNVATLKMQLSSTTINSTSETSGCYQYHTESILVINILPLLLWKLIEL